MKTPTNHSAIVAMHLSEMGDDFTLTFDFNNKIHWELLKKSMVYILISIFGLLYYFLTNEELGWFIAIFILIPLFPQLIIHIQYYSADRNKTIVVNHSKRILIIDQKDTKRTIPFDEIEKIVLHQGQRDRENYTLALPFFFYNYSEIKLNNGDSLVFTDFITPNISLKGIPKEVEISFINVLK